MIYYFIINKKITLGGYKMSKYVCTICGFVYDEAEGYEEGGIEPNTKWEDIDDSFVCPLCGASKDEFEQE